MLLFILADWLIYTWDRTAVGDVASLQSNHSILINCDTRRSVPVGERNALTEVFCLTKVVNSQRRSDGVVFHASPVHTRSPTGRPVHCSTISIAGRIRQTLLLRIWKTNRCQQNRNDQFSLLRRVVSVLPLRMSVTETARENAYLRQVIYLLFQNNNLKEFLWLCYVINKRIIGLQNSHYKIHSFSRFGAHLTPKTFGGHVTLATSPFLKYWDHIRTVPRSPTFNRFGVISMKHPGSRLTWPWARHLFHKF